MKRNKMTKFSPKNEFKKIKRFFLRLSNFKIILMVYTFVTLFFSIFLFLPITHQAGKNVSFIDALFTAASAFSDTGLTTVVTAHTWNTLGQAIIAILIVLGGVGIFALKVYIINVIFKQPISLLSRNILEKERSATDSGNIKKTIKISITILFISIIISTFALMFVFYYESGNFLDEDKMLNPQGDWATSFKYAVFHSISALNNAGFDILSSSSLQPYYSVYSIQIIFIILLVLGGIGYPVIYDVYQYIYSKIRRRTDFRFSLFTKISCITYAVIVVLGLSLTLMFEIGNKGGLWYNNDPMLGNHSDKMMAIFFHVFSTRNAGFATLQMGSFSEITLVIFSIMMFIGSAPSSTAGGIRTTTIAIIFLAIWNKLRGVDDVRVFNRKIVKSTTWTSFMVLTISMFIVVLGIIIGYTSLGSMWGTAHEEIQLVDVIFEVSSAFGTTGLSSGLTPHLNIASKLYLILTMFIGQLGISSTILVWKSNKNVKKDFDYIQEDILIG